MQAVGWLSSLILVATIGSQVLRQWRECDARGVSPWLFVGQTSASVGFVAYSIWLESPVFIATNSILLLAAILGLVTWWRARRRACRT